MKMNIEEWRARISKYFPNYVYPAEIALTVICQLKIKDVFNPFGIIFVGDSSSGKTTVLDFFLASKDKTYRSDNFTASAFVSQASNVPRHQLEAIDLIKRIENKAMIVKELSPLFGKPKEHLLYDFSVLTTVFDGMGYTRDAGTHGQRGYSENILFMFLGATIPFNEDILELIGKLGARILFFKFPTHYRDGQEMAKELTTGLSYRTKLIRCQEATNEFLDALWNQVKEKVKWDRKADNLQLVQRLCNIALLGAFLRSPVDIHFEGEKQKYLPRIEGPMRLGTSLYNFCRSHALICGRNTLHKEDITFALRIVLDSAPESRVKILKLALENQGKIQTSEVEEILDCSKPTALKRMKELDALGIATLSDMVLKHAGRREHTLTLSPKFSWLNEEWFFDLLRQAHTSKSIN